MDSLKLLQRGTTRQFFRTQQWREPLQQSQRQPTYRTRPQLRFIQSRALHNCNRVPFTSKTAFTKFPRRGTRGFATAAVEEKLSLSQRLRKLSREYGWSALGVYLLLSAADFPFCFLAVRLLGTDRIGHWEHVVVTTVKEWISIPFGKETQQIIDGAVEEVEQTVQKKVAITDVNKDGQDKRILDEENTYVVTDHGYKEAEAANSGSNASLWTQLVLAYAIHKSFIFIRVPLTAAVTPKVVKTLRSWGWDIGKRPAKKVTTSATTSSGSSGTGVNTKGTGVKKD